MINTTFPVLLPDMPELRMSKQDFEAYIRRLSDSPAAGGTTKTSLPIRAKSDDATTTKAEKAATTYKSDASEDERSEKPGSRFMDGLLSDKKTVPSLDDRDGKMLTENADVAYRTSGEALVDLFSELEDVISGNRLRDVLETSWTADSDATLKIIWNARSIHLGKSSRNTFYRAIGWLAESHPATLLTNLPWLVRPLIQKKTPKQQEKKHGGEEVQAEDAEMIEAKDADSDFELIDEKEELEGQPESKKLKLDEDAELTKFDVKYGVAHGYWKDLLNILALAANDELKADGSPRSVLNVEKPKEKVNKRDWTEGKKKAQVAERHERALEKLENDSFYKALHLSVARLFAEQLKNDIARLESGKKAEIKHITLAAKWAPSHKGMHDQHTCIVSTIAELLYPFHIVCADTDVDPADRALYLKHARQAYQLKTLSPLRKVLQIVERPITASNFEEIEYERVPSLAMRQYTPLFAKKDFERFDTYIERVAQGKSRISGATLLPSTLIKDVSDGGYSRPAKGKATAALVEQKLRAIQSKSLDGQWNTLVQRIKDSGTLESSIAVCDVSGSMSSPRFPDGTCPMDSSVGLSLLVAEVTKPPFGGAFITFSNNPQVLRCGGPDDSRSLKQKVDYIRGSDWGYSTDFVAVFERLILPMAQENKLKQEDMVKQIFVFSDMQFNSANHGQAEWSTSYERIQKKFEEAGYRMPKLIFWNLAGGRAGYGGSHGVGDETAPKPVTAAEEGTSLVSGYSQGQMKMFLDNGQFEDPEDEIVTEEQDGDEVVVEKKKAKQDPLATVRKAISHEAYRMLKVVD